ncbi:hypothetical protein Q5P01_009396 [Channa striata]|uniref:Interleukin-9 n=1 Tax=Channa striata TaxID=64152 RepID=A0AA88N184_CHASR|nr:hypothetical protein Q5P01_009396 [Channa striata]
MTVLCASCSAWMLPLLLLLHLLVSLSHSSSIPTVPPLHEFNILVDNLGKIVENCSENCSLGHSTSQRCQCLNISVSQEECSFPNYFINGLNSLRTSTDTEHQNTIQYLNYYLKDMRGLFKKSVGFCSSPVNTNVLVSPKCLHKKLQFLKEQMNSDPYIPAKNDLPTMNCELVQ